MTNQELLELVETRIAKRLKTLDYKGGEYATPDDRLHNFYRLAEFARVTPEQVCLILMGKHLISVVDAIVDKRVVTQEWIDEKLGDPDVYIPLLEAIMMETRERASATS